jgi:hypothetical protein
MSDEPRASDQKDSESLYQRQIEEARRVIREEWPEWMRRNRDAVHVPIRRDTEGLDATRDE